MGRRLTREGIYACMCSVAQSCSTLYVQLIHSVVQQKLTQHYKEMILQLKKQKSNNVPIFTIIALG